MCEIQWNTINSYLEFIMMKVEWDCQMFLSFYSFFFFLFCSFISIVRHCTFYRSTNVHLARNTASNWCSWLPVARNPRYILGVHSMWTLCSSSASNNGLLFHLSVYVLIFFSLVGFACTFIFTNSTSSSTFQHYILHKKKTMILHKLKISTKKKKKNHNNKSFYFL